MKIVNRSWYDTALDVLVIEDDDDLAEALMMLLQEHGHRARRAANGLEALAILRNGDQLPDTIVLDLRMPVMNGWEFRLEQKKDPALAPIPVIAVSADNSAQAQAIHSDAMLSKPIDGAQLLSTLQSVTEKCRTDALSQQAQVMALGKLAAGVAHEINNPLSYILGNLSLLDEHVRTGKNPFPPEEVQALVDETLQGARRIAQVVRDMQTFSYIRDEHPEITDLRNVADSVLSISAATLRGRAQVIRGYDKPVMVRGPPARLAQLFLHLVLNAVDAMSESNPPRNQLTVRLRTEGDRAIAEFLDTGKGIPAGILGRIFEPFFTTKAPRSTGLGLYVCKRIVNQLDGDLTVESEVGSGSTFRVSLPILVEKKDWPNPALDLPERTATNPSERV
jgi:signal transduction histidine kinase